jgi:hypothetical protein
MNTLANSELAFVFLCSCCAKATFLLVCAGDHRNRTSPAFLCRSTPPRLGRRDSRLARASYFHADASRVAFRRIRQRGSFMDSHARECNGLPFDRNSFHHHHVASTSSLFSKLAGVTLLGWAIGLSFVILRLLAGLACLAWVSAHAKPLFDDSWMSTVLEISKFYKIDRSVRLLQCSSPLAMPLAVNFSLAP